MEKQVRKVVLGWPTNVGELKQILGPFVDECQLSEQIEISYCIKEDEGSIEIKTT